MKQIRIFLLLAVLIFTVTALGQTVVTTPAVVTSARVPGTVFRDCSDCPEMVVVPAGNFTMGSSEDRKSTRLNSSHLVISYAVFCLKKKKMKTCHVDRPDRPIPPSPPRVRHSSRNWPSSYRSACTYL